MQNPALFNIHAHIFIHGNKFFCVILFLIKYVIEQTVRKKEGQRTIALFQNINSVFLKKNSQS